MKNSTLINAKIVGTVNLLRNTSMDFNLRKLIRAIISPGSISARYAYSLYTTLSNARVVTRSIARRISIHIS